MADEFFSSLLAEFNISFTGFADIDIDDLAPDYNPDLAKISIALIICGLGLIGNLLVLFVIVVLKEYQKSVTHLYVLQLAIANGIFLMTIPFSASEELSNAFLFSEWVCKIKETLLFINYYSSMFFLTIMSMDRYFAVCHHFSVKVEKLRKPRTAVVITVLAWLVSSILSVPIFLFSFKKGLHPNCFCTYAFPKYESNEAICHREGYRTEEEIASCMRTLVTDVSDGVEKYCTRAGAGLSEVFENIGRSYLAANQSQTSSFDDDNNNQSTYDEDDYVMYYDDLKLDTDNECHYLHHTIGWNTFIFFNFLVMFLVPLFVMLVCYGLIIRRLSEAQAIGSTTSAVSFTVSKRTGNIKRRKISSRSEKDRKRVTIMCGTLVASFIVCWLPFHAVHIAKIAVIRNTTSAVCKRLFEAGTLLAYLNAALNPYLYSFLGTDFTRRWNRLKSAGGLNQLMTRFSRKNSDSSGQSAREGKDRKSRSGSAHSRQTNNLVQTSPENASKNNKLFLPSTPNSGARLQTPSSSQFMPEVTLHQEDSTQQSSIKEDKKEAVATHRHTWQN